MALGTALNIGLGVAGFFDSRAARRNALRWQAYEADMRRRSEDRQARLANVNLNLAGQAFVDRQRENERLRFARVQDQMRANELQNYLRRGDMENIARLEQDRADVAARQREQDAAEARRRRDQIADFERREQLAADEQQLYFDLLAQERAFLERERAEERELGERGRAILADEYRDRKRIRDEDRRTRAREAALTANRLDAIRNQSGAVRDQLSRIASEFGNIQAPEYLGDADIDRLAEEYGEADIALLNQMLDRTSSQSDADLIRRGLDGSPGIASGRRADILAKLMPQISKAREEARGRAIADVGAKNKIRDDRFNALRAVLADRMKSAEAAGTSGLDLEARYAADPTSVYEGRAIGSAYSPYAFRDPRTSVAGAKSPIGFQSLDIGSMVPSSTGLSSYMRPGNATYSFSGQDASIGNIYQPDLTDPSSYLSNAGYTYGGDNFDKYGEYAASAGKQMGDSFANVLDEIEGTKWGKAIFDYNPFANFKNPFRRRG